MGLELVVVVGVAKELKEARPRRASSRVTTCRFPANVSLPAGEHHDVAIRVAHPTLTVPRTGVDPLINDLCSEPAGSLA